MTPAMLQLDDQQQAARDWFESLRDRICAAFEEIEREAGSDAAFAYTPWERTDDSGESGGGGVRGQMAGKVFEKVGVNVSTVGGSFSPEFARSIPGAAEDPSFFATGISLVAHMANPHVPAVHMNTRFLTTTKRWFGGGAGDALREFGAELAADGRDIDPDLLEHLAGHLPAYAAAAEVAAVISPLPRDVCKSGVGTGLALDRLELGADAIAQVFEPVARGLLLIVEGKHHRRHCEERGDEAIRFLCWIAAPAGAGSQ